MKLREMWRLSRGWRERRLIEKSGLFDAAWYLSCNPDVAEAGGDALHHYIAHGDREGRKPNPLFDPLWYRSRHPDAGASALRHYIIHGAQAGASPSGHFDALWYLKKNPDVAAAGLEPLAHYMRHGKREGRRPRPSAIAPRPVLAAQWRALKPFARMRGGGDLALFVTHAPGGAVKPHARLHARALREHGFSLVIIAATDNPDSAAFTDWAEETDGFYARDNEGFDFAAWAHAAREITGVETAGAILLVNDSVVGPLAAGAFASVVARLRASRAELVGLTDNHEHLHHLQSYFLYAKGRGVAALLEMLADVVSYADKEDVIDAYEVTLLERFRRQGLVGEALFPARTRTNDSVWRWRELIEEGMPYVKVQALRGIPGLDNSGWRAVLAARGYDPAIAQAALDISATIVARRAP